MCVLERLEAFHKQSVSRVEEESYFDDFDTFEEAIKTLNLPYGKPRDIVDIDDVDGFFMSGDSNTDGSLCIAFQHPDNSVTLLRELCEKNQHGEPLVSHAWLPETNFKEGSPVSLTEQEHFLKMRYYNTSPQKPLVFKYVFMDDEQDESFMPKTQGENPVEPVETEEEKQKALELLMATGLLKKNADGEFEFQRIRYQPNRIGCFNTKDDD